MKINCVWFYVLAFLLGYVANNVMRDLTPGGCKCGCKKTGNCSCGK